MSKICLRSSRNLAIGKKFNQTFCQLLKTTFSNVFARLVFWKASRPRCPPKTLETHRNLVSIVDMLSLKWREWSSKRACMRSDRVWLLKEHPGGHKLFRGLSTRHLWDIRRWCSSISMRVVLNNRRPPRLSSEDLCQGLRPHHLQEQMACWTLWTRLRCSKSPPRKSTRSWFTKAKTQSSTLPLNQKN